MGNIDIILSITFGLFLALTFGFITQKLKLSPIVGYLIAGFIVGPHTPGTVANEHLAKELAEIGIILLMFSVGLHFRPKDLLSVQKIALPGSLIEITIMTTIGTLVGRYFNLPLNASILLGISVSIASTVILTRVLQENGTFNTQTGHIATGWLIVEDFFTILVLVLAPILLVSSHTSFNQVASVLSLAIFKIIMLVVFIIFIGKRILPRILIYIAKTNQRDLFTLSVIVIALGIAVLSTKLFGASMALGAFLAGMLVGQSDFGARATAEALPIKDTFAVLFFLSIGMLFNPLLITKHLYFSLVVLGLVIIVKPLVATFIVSFILRQPLKRAISIGFSLGQIGEFSFIIAGLGIQYNLFNDFITNAIITAAIISITLNHMVYKNINFIYKILNKLDIKDKNQMSNEPLLISGDEKHRIIIIGYGPVGKCLTQILQRNGFSIVIIEMNIDTVRKIKKQNIEGIQVIYGDANNREILRHAGIDFSQAFIISTSGAPSKELIKLVRSLNPKIRILAHTHYLNESKFLNKQSPNLQMAFSGEYAVAVSLSRFLMKELNFEESVIEKECSAIEETLL